MALITVSKESGLSGASNFVLTSSAFYGLAGKFGIYKVSREFGGDD